MQLQRGIYNTCSGHGQGRIFQLFQQALVDRIERLLRGRRLLELRHRFVNSHLLLRVCHALEEVFSVSCRSEGCLSPACPAGRKSALQNPTSSKVDPASGASDGRRRCKIHSARGDGSTFWPGRAPPPTSSAPRSPPPPASSPGAQREFDWLPPAALHRSGLCTRRH